MTQKLPINPTKELSLFYCTKCGKGWPHFGLSGAVSSIKNPGFADHFPNCPGEPYDSKI